MSIVEHPSSAPDRVFLRGRRMAEHFFRATDQQLSHTGGWDLVFGDRFGRGVLNLDGPLHRDYRKALLPLLTRRAVGGYETVVHKVLDRALSTVPTDRPVDLHTFLKPVVFEISATLFAGIDSELAAELLVAYSRLQDPGAALGTADGDRVARKVVGARRRQREILSAAVERAAELDGPVQRLRALPDPPSDDVIAQNLSILILAGFETTGYVTARLLWLLARHPEHQDAIRADTTGARLEAAFAETTRLHPPLAWLPRRAGTELNFDGTAIPAGSGVFFAVADTHRDPDVFEAPDEFRPERHSGSSPGKFAQVPFSAGRRVCPGIHMGTMEAKVITTRILRRFQLSAPPGGYVGDVCRNGSTVCPAAALPARFHPLP